MDEAELDIYFTKEYHSLFEEIGDGVFTEFIFKQDEKIAVYRFLKNSVNSLGFNLDSQYFDIQSAYGYSGISWPTNDPVFVRNFHNKFSLYCENNNIIAEFTRFHPLIKNHYYSSSYMSVMKDREIVVIDLCKPYSEIWANEYSSKNRNMVRKAKINDHKIQIIRSPSTQEIDNFIRIYNSSMDSVNSDRYYYFNRKFFNNTFAFLNKYTYLINVIDINGATICSSIFFHYGNYFHYHLSGRISNADNSVNNFLIDQAVVFAQEIGAEFLNLGGGRTDALNDSLLKFKGNFSKARVPFYIGKKIHNQNVYDEVINQWESKFQSKKKKYEVYLLKYRY